MVHGKSCQAEASDANGKANIDHAVGFTSQKKCLGYACPVNIRVPTKYFFLSTQISVGDFTASTPTWLYLVAN